MWLLGCLLFAAEHGGLVPCLLSVFAHSYARIIPVLISGHCWPENGNSGMGPVRKTQVWSAMSMGNEADGANGSAGSQKKDMIEALSLQHACMNIEVFTII
jgi:hypothetical protein